MTLFLEKPAHHCDATSSFLSNLFSFVELWMDELPVEDAGSLGCRRQQPQNKKDLELIVERQPTSRKKVKLLLTNNVKHILNIFNIQFTIFYVVKRV